MINLLKLLASLFLVFCATLLIHITAPSALAQLHSIPGHACSSNKVVKTSDNSVVQNCDAEGKTCITFLYGSNNYAYCNLDDGGYPSLGYFCRNNNTTINNNGGVVRNCSLSNQVCAVENERVKCVDQATDTCTTVGNSTIGNQREYECQASCGSGRVQYSDRNSSCTSGICCRLVATGGGSTPPPAAPTPTPTMPSEIGYCADHDRTKEKPINGATCGINNAAWIDRSSGTGSGYDPYCNHTYGNEAEYFYQCPTVTTTPPPTATPTPYQPLPEGGSCNPLQGTWQCEGGSYCSQACSSSSASCTTGRCCPYGKSWNGSACVADPTPTEPPAAQPTATPAPPIDTGDACPDVNPGTNPPVFNVCRPAAPGCLTAEGETPKANSKAHDTCSNFYGGSYLCCQRAPQQGAAGSSCNLNPRRCDTSQNSSNGTNIQCTGCGGYCVPNSSGQGICMSQ